MTANVYKH